MFQLKQTAQDLDTFSGIIKAFLRAVPADAWDTPTGTREKDWTLHETLAHLVSVAMLLNEATDAALNAEPLDINGLNMREDLRDWNTVEVAEYVEEPPAALTDRLLRELATAAKWARNITTEGAAETILLPMYNRPAPVRNLIDWQLSHAGVVHAAQLAHGAGTEPLWTQYEPDFTRRQLDRFMRHFSWAYWPEFGEGQHTTLNLHVEGEGGGVWHLVAAPNGGTVGAGAAVGAAFNLRFADPATMFGLFTVHLSLKDALKSEAVRCDEDFKAAFSLLRLFSPSPPG